jgi:hypothetical protein
LYRRHWSRPRTGSEDCQRERVMKNNKKDNNEKNKEVNKEMNLDAWADAPGQAWVMELAEYAPPNASLAQLVMLGRALSRRSWPEAAAGEVAAQQRLAMAVETSARALKHNEQMTFDKVDRHAQRARLVRLVTSMTDAVAVQARSPEPDLAAEARQLQLDAFEAGFDPARTPSHALVLKVEALRERLEAAPMLRTRLERYVGATTLVRLFEASSQYGDAMMEEEEWKTGQAPALNLRAVGAQLRQRMAEYVANVLATVNADDPLTMARAKKALRAVETVRGQLAMRRSRRAREARGEVVDGEEPELEDLIEDEDLDEPRVTPSPTPVKATVPAAVAPGKPATAPPPAVVPPDGDADG